MLIFFAFHNDDMESSKRRVTFLSLIFFLNLYLVFEMKWNTDVLNTFLVDFTQFSPELFVHGVDLRSSRHQEVDSPPANNSEAIGTV